jgi:hypothetical protein
VKFGAIFYKDSINIGDDIQTFAVMRHLPRVDCFLDRESLDAFEPDDGRPVAVPMCGWYMDRKWHWPPSRFVVPLLTSMHYDARRNGKRPGCPVGTEFLSGRGADWWKAWGPVGCRDFHTLELFRERGIDAYFSGCVTLTLPNMERRKDGREYICACDLPGDILAKLKETVAGRCEVVETTHLKDAPDGDRPWAEREKRVKDLLTLYQNAKCVVTKRLHCALPCLAMGVPVFLTNKDEVPDAGRYAPYYDWIRHCTWKRFLAGESGYDFLDPPPNGTGHLPVREALAASIAAFAAKWKDEDGPPERYGKAACTGEEFARWRTETMRRCLDAWQAESEESKREMGQLRRFRSEAETELRALRAKAAECESLEREAKHWRKLFTCRTVKWAVKLRNLLLPGKNRLLSFAEAEARRNRRLKKKARAAAAPPGVARGNRNG